MRTIATHTYEEMSSYVSDCFEEIVRKKPTACMSCAAGTTQEGLYKELASRFKKNGLSFRELQFFNMDEYIGVNKEHPVSLNYFLEQNFYRIVDVDPAKVHVPKLTHLLPSNNSVYYDELISGCGGLDLLVLGIGADGHIAFNMPDGVFHLHTHRERLTNDIIARNTPFFSKSSDVPTHAVTIGVKTILDAKKIILMAHGDSKKKVLEQLLSNKMVTPLLPASILWLHNDVTIIADQGTWGKEMNGGERIV